VLHAIFLLLFVKVSVGVVVDLMSLNLSFLGELLLMLLHVLLLMALFHGLQLTALAFSMHLFVVLLLVLVHVVHLIILARGVTLGHLLLVLLLRRSFLVLFYLFLGYRL
jgi:hypothetical protein